MVLFENVHLNQKVEVNWRRRILSGTVKYKGPLHISAGEWVGVQLDKQVGDHDGRIQGRTYFQCMDGFGIFVRSENIRFVRNKRNLFSRYRKTPVVPNDQEQELFQSGATELIREPVVINRSLLKELEEANCESDVWSSERHHPLRHAVSRSVPPARTTDAEWMRRQYSARADPVHDQNWVYRAPFITPPTIKRIHMPHDALENQVRRGWKGEHYVREMSVPTGKDSIKRSQWNDISA